MAGIFSVLCLGALLDAGHLEDFAKDAAIFAASDVILREDGGAKEVVVTDLLSLEGELTGVIYVLPLLHSTLQVGLLLSFEFYLFQSCHPTLSSTDRIFFL